MTSAWLAFRTVQRYRARTALATMGVAIIGALLFDMLLLSRGLVTSFADLLDHSGYDIRVLNSEGLSLARAPIPRASGVSAAIERLPEVAAVARIRFEPAVGRRRRRIGNRRHDRRQHSERRAPRLDGDRGHGPDGRFGVQ